MSRECVERIETIIVTVILMAGILLIGLHWR